MKLRNYLILFFLISMIGACGSNGGDTDDSQVDPTGAWSVSYNRILDECELLPAGSTGFDDDETIIADGTTVTLNSAELPLEEYFGDFRSRDSFTASNEVSGDLFGVGMNCVLSEGVSFNNIDSTSASTVYEVKIVCDDGSRCDSLLRGTATKLQ
ncbi:MAG: hypothetical protein KDD60_03625 [Bdellovibrionales bacterium]|nr:hypothetical protein [Bdellovibrionales bacterium]